MGAKTSSKNMYGNSNCNKFWEGQVSQMTQIHRFFTKSPSDHGQEFGVQHPSIGRVAGWCLECHGFLLPKVIPDPFSNVFFLIGKICNKTNPVSVIVKYMVCTMCSKCWILTWSCNSSCLDISPRITIAKLHICLDVFFFTPCFFSYKYMYLSMY